MNGFRSNGEWQNNAACRYPEWPDYGVSANLMRRLYYFSYLNGANITQPEEWSAYFLAQDEKAGKTMLTPRGRDYAAYHDFTRAHPGRGVPYAPVAICIPLSRGYPAFGGWPWAAKAYGYTRSDWMSDAVFFTIVPGFERAKAIKAGIETNLHNSRFAQMYDVICPDATSQSPERVLDVMKSYRALVVAGEFADPKVATCLAEYEKGGGRVVWLPASLFANLDCSQIANATTINLSDSSRLIGDLKAGKMRFPEIEAIFEGLQNDYFPFKVEGDCLYGANRTEGGWWLWVFNNKGVTKFTDAPHIVDHSFDADIKVSLRDVCGGVGTRRPTMAVKELLTERPLPVENGAFRHRVAAGDLAVFGIRSRIERP